MFRRSALLLIIASLAACGTPKHGMVVRVADLPDGSALPAKYGQDGGDISPAIAWSGPPTGTRAIALIVEDPDAPGGSFTHWAVYDLPPSSGLFEALPRNPELPGGGRQGQNDFGGIGWSGPAPPPGKAHHYVFEVFALSAPTGMPAGATVDALRGAMKGKILSQGRWTGTYKR